MAEFYDATYLEQVYAALFDKLKAAKFPDGTGFRLSARVVEAPDEVALTNQPALFQVQGPLEVVQQQGFSLAKWTFTALAIVYARTDGAAPLEQQTLAQTIANNIVWALMLALTPTPHEVQQTLDGLVYHCWFEGQVFTEVQNDQMIITVPVYILPGPVG
jgi:hypothetical protein